MNLSTLTENQVKTFAGEVIFERGADYFREGSVREFDYYPDERRIEATVEGNYDNYIVDINDGDDFGASCDCPYDGYPCKHIVAVLLHYIEQRGSVQQKGKQTKKETFSLKKSLMNLEREDLIQIILDEAAKSKEMRQRLEIRFRGVDENVLEQMKKDVNSHFPRTGRGVEHFSETRTAKAVQKMMKNFVELPPDVRAELYWEVVDCSLYLLNEYGINHNAIESLVTDGLNTLIALMKDHDLPDKRSMIIQNLVYFFDKGSFRIKDDVLNAAGMMAHTKGDYAIILESLNRSLQILPSKYYGGLAENFAKNQAKAPEN